MIEMRWKEILSQVQHQGQRPVVNTVLEYRQQTVSGEWSEWRAVPTVQQIGS